MAPTAQPNGDQLHIELASSDPNLAAELEGQTPEQAGRICQDIFDLGVAVRRLTHQDQQLANLETQLAQFEQRITELTQTAATQLAEQIDHYTNPETGSLPAITRQSAEQLQTVISKALATDDRDSAATLLLEAVNTQTSHSVNRALDDIRILLDATRDESPLGTMRRQLADGFAGPLTQVTEQVTQMHAVVLERTGRTKTAHEGVTFETELGDRLADIAAGCGDLVNPVGAEPGIGDAKTGDYIVEVNTGNPASAARFVIEAKNKRLTVPKMIAELDAACENRQTDIGLLVVAETGQGVGDQPVTRLRDNRYVAVADRDDDPTLLGLRIGYQIARIDAIRNTHSQRTANGDTIDLTSLLDQLERLQHELKTAATIRKSMTSAERNIQSGREHLNGMIDRIGDMLTDIETSVREAIGTNEPADAAQSAA